MNKTFLLYQMCTITRFDLAIKIWPNIIILTRDGSVSHSESTFPPHMQGCFSISEASPVLQCSGKLVNAVPPTLCYFSNHKGDLLCSDIQPKSHRGERGWLLTVTIKINELEYQAVSSHSGWCEALWLSRAVMNERQQKQAEGKLHTLSLSLSLSRVHTHTHTLVLVSTWWPSADIIINSVN